MLAIGPDNVVGGLLGMALLALLCGGYGYILIGGVVRATPKSWFEFAGLCILAGFAAISWIGCLLAVASLFRWWLLLAIAAALGYGVRRWARQAAPLDLAPTSSIMQLGALAVLGCAAWLFARPSETWMLFDDSAVYTISGVHLAEAGTLIPSVENFVCKGHQVFRYWGPYRWWDGCKPTLSVGFLPAPKVWAGIATWLFGRGGAVWSAPFAGLLAMLVLFLFTRRAVGPLAALATTALVAMSFPQVWFSRTLMSETFSQVAVFGGLYYLSLAREGPNQDKPQLWGMLAAALLGLLAFIRFEALLFLLIILAAWLVAMAAGDPGPSRRWSAPWMRRWLLWTGGATLVALSLSFAVTPHYYLDQLVKLLSRDSLQLAVIAAAALALAVVGLRRYGPRRLWGTLCGWPLARILLVALALVWVLVAGADLYLRGVSSSGVTSWLPLYLGWPAFLLGALGLLWFVWKRPSPEAYGLLTLALLSATGFALHPLVTQVHPWAIRRFVPFILPTLMMGIGFALERVWAVIRSAIEGGIRFWRWPAYGASLLCVGVAGAFVGRVTWPFVTYQETAGLWAQMEELAALYPPGAIVIYDNGPMGQRLPQVMEQVLGPSAIAYLEPPGPLEIARLEGAIKAARGQGRRVFMNVVDGDLMWDSQEYGMESYDAYVVEAPRVRYEHIPPPTEASIATMRFLVDIYEIVPREELTLLQGPVMPIPVGQGSYSYLKEGFFSAEVDAKGRPFRWTSDEAHIVVPAPVSVSAPSVGLALDLGAWRPSGAGETVVTVEVQGRTVLEVRVEHVVEPQRFEVTLEDALAPDQKSLEIVLRTSTWRPADYGMEDTRELGAIFYGATLRWSAQEG